MNELRRIFRNQLCAVVGLVALSSLVPFQVAQAQEVSDPAFNRFRAQVVGNNVNFSYGGAGTPLGGSGNATGIGVGAGVDVGRGTSISTKHGPILGSLKQKISSPAMGRAVGRVAALGVMSSPLGLLFLAAPAIIDWFSQADVVAGPDGSIGTRSQTRACNVAGVSGASCTAAMAAYLAERIAAGGMHPEFKSWCEPENYVVAPMCHVGWSVGGSSSGAWQASYTGPLETAVVPATPLQIEEALSTTNPSPAALAELYKLGETIREAHPIPDLVDTLRADFEARSPESVETKNSDTPEESKTEEKRCATYTQVSGSSVGLVEECETTTTTQPKDPVTGLPVGAPTTSTTTTSSTTRDPESDPKDEAKDPCIDAPNRVSCIELGTPTGEIPKDTRSVEYEPEVLFGSGTCPADKTVVLYGMTLPLTDMTKTCDLLADYVRPIALLLAAFTALMIVAVGVPE